MLTFTVLLLLIYLFGCLERGPYAKGQRACCWLSPTGRFWMSWTDFCEIFDEVEICPMNDCAKKAGTTKLHHLFTNLTDFNVVACHPPFAFVLSLCMRPRTCRQRCKSLDAALEIKVGVDLCWDFGGDATAPDDDQEIA